MYQIDNSTAAQAIPASTAAGSKGYFTDGNPATGTPATILPAEFMNMLMMENLNVLTAGGVTPDKAKYNQLAIAISNIVASGIGNGINWSKITGTPTTRSGYGITDVYTRQESDQQINYRAIRDGITTVGLANNDPKLPYVRRESDNTIYYLQPNLGFAPVQQGTGVGQLPGYPVKIGWSGSNLKATVNDLDLGSLWSSSNFDPNTKSNWGTKLSDYRITDAFTKAEVNTALAQKWDVSTYPPAQYIKLGQNIQAGSNLRCGSGGSGPIANISSGTGAMEFHNDGVAAASAVVMFNRQGSFSAYLGLDTDNQFKVGGWSMGNNSYVLWHAGNLGQATEAVPGIAKIATTAQLNAGIDDASMLTSKKIRLGFYASLTTNGYIVFPQWLGSFIIQWGRYSLAAPAGSSVAITFPIPFGGTFTPMPWAGVDGGATDQIGTQGVTTTGMTVSKGSADISARTGSWFAFGGAF